MPKKVTLEMKNISKTFGEVKALRMVNLKLHEGRAMALVGENGAGKSTIIKCIGGVHKVSGGQMYVNGKNVKFHNVKDASKSGIAIVHQELKLAENLSVAQNIFLGKEIKKFGLINYKKQNNEARKYLNILNTSFGPKEQVSSLGIADQQMVEIAKALSSGAKIIILDEPTDSLSDKEVDSLFKVIKSLKKKNISFLYVTHRMNEIKQICEDYTIFKDGEYIEDGEVKDVEVDYIISKMIGRELSDQFPDRNNTIGNNAFTFENYSNEYISNISLSLKKGEILGLAGLVGSGRTEFAKTIIGALRRESGTLYINGKRKNIKKIHQSIQNHIFYVSENRKLDGLDVNASIRDNMIIANLKMFMSKFRIINYKKINEVVKNSRSNMQIKMNSLNDPVSSLSGGNQQKVLLAKALITNPQLLILDEPTRGVDVGARREIYQIINEVCESGASVLMISSDLPEIIGMADRVIVFHEGQISGQLTKKNMTEENIMFLATGNKKKVRYKNEK